MSEFLGVLYWMTPSIVAVGLFVLLAITLKTQWKWLGLIPVTAIVVVNTVFVYWLANFKM